MPRKRPSLDAQISKKVDTPPSKEADAPTSKKVDESARIQVDKPKRQRTPARQGKKAISGFFEPEVARQLKVMAAEQDKTVQALLGEGLNLLFEKYGKDAIAPED